MSEGNITVLGRKQTRFKKAFLNTGLCQYTGIILKTEIIAKKS